MDSNNPSSEESYFVSMTDMLVGMLFIFLILLMYFALQLTQQKERYETENRRLTDAAEERTRVRTKILEKVKGDLELNGVKVELDTSTGVLRLPNEILFAKGRADLTEGGRQNLEILAGSLQKILPCYTESGRKEAADDCEPTPHRIEALFIEGHTDSDPIAPGAAFKDNWELSTARANQTYRVIVSAESRLETLSSIIGDRSQPILSVAGYADRRPVIEGDDEEAKSKNRRIDMRLIMASPRPDALSEIDRQIGPKP